MLIESIVLFQQKNESIRFKIFFIILGKEEQVLFNIIKFNINLYDQVQKALNQKKKITIYFFIRMQLLFNLPYR